MRLVSKQILDMLLPSYPLLKASERTRILADTEHFLSGHIRNASFVVRAGVLALSLAFRAWMGLARTLRWSPIVAMNRWEVLAGDPGRSFLRLVRSLAVLFFLEHPLVLHALGMPQVRDQQAEFRGLRQHLMHKGWS